MYMFIYNAGKGYTQSTFIFNNNQFMSLTKTNYPNTNMIPNQLQSNVMLRTNVNNMNFSNLEKFVFKSIDLILN